MWVLDIDKEMFVIVCHSPLHGPLTERVGGECFSLTLNYDELRREILAAGRKD